MAAVALGVAAVGAGVYSSRQARKAGEAQARSADAAVAEQARQFDTVLSLTAPQRHIGNQALNALGRAFGYSPYVEPEEPLSFQEWAQSNPLDVRGHFGGGGGIVGAGVRAMQAQQKAYEQYLQDFEQQQQQTQGTPDLSGFQASPGYQFRLQQGQQAVQNSAAARGGLYSGNALRALTEYGQNLASEEFGNWFNQQAALAGIGQAATSQAASGALTTGANIGNLLMAQGNARASGIMGQADAIGNTINQLGALYGLYRGGAFGGGMGNSMALNYGGPMFGGGLA